MRLPVLLLADCVALASGCGGHVGIKASGISSGSQPANLLLVGGDGQTGTVGQPLSIPFTVKVTDASGNPVSGMGVSFTVTAGGGMLTATQASTDSQGLASSTLTLGATPGTNTVIAASGTLAGSPITINATGMAAGGQTRITWTKVWTSPQQSTPGVPGWNGWLTLHYDRVSQQTILYGTGSGSVSIYSTDLYFYNSSSHAWTYLRGTGSLINACPLDTATQPGDRHPVGQMAIDTKRNVLWLYGGVNQTCGGNPAGPNSNPRLDMYYLQLAANPLNDVWHRVTPAHIPAANISATMVYDPDDDVLFSFGYDNGASVDDNWVYCPGTLTAKQIVAGCTAADDWTEVVVKGGVQPLGVNFPGMVYDTVSKKVIMYGGTSSGLDLQYNQTWAYDVPSRTWTQKALSTTPPPVFNGSSGVNQPPLAYNSTTQKILYHQTSNSGAPADWQYDPLSDTWAKLVSAGGGAQIDQYLAYDPRNNLLIGWNQNTSTGGADLWQGTLSPTLSGSDRTSSYTTPILHAQVRNGNRFQHLK